MWLASPETPAFQDRLVRAQEQAAFRPANMVRDLGMIVTSGVAVVGLAVVLATVHPVLLVLPVAAVVPLWSTSISGGRAFPRHMVRNTPNRRLISYLRGVLTVRESAKRARALGPGRPIARAASETKGLLADKPGRQGRAALAEGCRVAVRLPLGHSSTS